MVEAKKTIKVIGTGSFLPDKVLTNSDLEKMVETSDEWIVTRSGIKERRLVGSNTSTSDIAAAAATSALKNANLTPDKLDLIIVATVTADYVFPSTACLVQDKIGAVNAAAFDISAACSGFLYGLITASSFLWSKVHQRVMVIGAETLSKITDWTDRSTCVLFGDGAGAVILELGNGGFEMLDYCMGADGSGSSLLEVPAGGSVCPASPETVENHMHFIKMKGNELYRWAVNKMKNLLDDAIERSGITVEDIAYIIPHQVNIRIIDAALKRLDLSRDKVIINLDKYGNTSAASIPIALDELSRSNGIKKGDVIIFVAFGSGLTWASCTVRW